MPLMVADDVGLLLLYASGGAERVVLKFTRACTHSFGLPNDEALAGHPLAKRGLRPYSTLKSSTPLGSVLWNA